MISDWECLELARNGDENAWRVLFQRYNASMIRIATLITGSLDAGKDVAQESFIRLIKCRPKHQKGNFKYYLAKIAYRLALKEKKRLFRNRPNPDNISIVEEVQSPQEDMIRDVQNKYIAQVIRSLPEHQRNILVLRFYGGHTYKEIAQITKIPLGTVKSRIFYAVTTCREKLQSKGVFK